MRFQGNNIKTKKEKKGKEKHGKENFMHAKLNLLRWSKQRGVGFHSC